MDDGFQFAAVRPDPALHDLIERAGRFVHLATHQRRMPLRFFWIQHAANHAVDEVMKPVLRFV